MATARAARARYPWTPCYFRSSEQASDVDSRNVQLDAALEPHLFLVSNYFFTPASVNVTRPHTVRTGRAYQYLAVQ